VKKMLVLIPEGFFVEYFLYNFKNGCSPENITANNIQHKGRIKFRNTGISGKEIISVVNNYKPDIVAVRVLYGGDDFNKTVVYNDSVRKNLEKQISHSPLHISLVLELINILKKTIPDRKIIMHFETAFFTALPEEEQIYALDTGLMNLDIKRYGYHGLFHNASIERVKRENKNLDKIISICLDPVPEVAAIYKNKPVMVSSGSTPLEGIPGNTTCGEIDPGIVLLIAEKEKCSPEMINEILTKKSGLSAIAGENVTIGDILRDNKINALAINIFKYRILLSCGSAIAMMNGFNLIVFSGKYVEDAHDFAEQLNSKLKTNCSNATMPQIFYLKESLDQIIAQNSLSFYNGRDIRLKSSKILFICFILALLFL
jgi:acetate kinase